MQQLLARYGHVVVVCPTSDPPAVERRLRVVRSLLESDRIALVRTDLPPLGAAVLVRQLRQLAGCDFSPGVLASAARLLAHYIYAGAVLGSVSRLDRVPVTLGSHLKSWLPGAHFAVLAAPTPQIVRIGNSETPLAGPDFGTELLLARGALPTEWPTATLVPRWGVQGPVQETALPGASPGWWGTGKLVEFTAYLPDLPVLYQLVASVRRETCHWCAMELIGDRCGFCAAPLATPAPAAPVAAPAPAPAAPVATPAPAAPAPAPVIAPAVVTPVPAAPAAPAEDGAYVTPLVRKLATENGVDLTAVKGSGVGGRIRKQDVLAAAEAAKAKAAAPAQAAPAAAAPKAPALEVSPLRGQTVKMTRMRKVIGDNMMKALHGQAQLTSVVEVDITKLMKLRGRAKDAFAAREGVKLSPMPFFVKAAAQALKAHPVINARINEDEGTITYFDTENIGIAVDSEKGLMTPVIKGAGDLNIAGISKKTAELAGAVRASKITPDDLAGATFTISNTGSRGALFDTIIVPPNQVAILGIGATVRRPVVINHPDLGETIAIRDMTYVALSYDHRLVDGADAARYLTSVKAILEAGEFEVDLGL
nr:2-oxoglutarate dehydrogenase, E2 component, dihydrolipoamide succinyltransferase [Streptomyces sp. CBMA291]